MSCSRALPALAALLAVSLPVGADTVCTGTITSLPVTILSPGTFCLAQNLSTALTSGNAVTINADDVTLDLRGLKLEGVATPDTRLTGVRALNRKRVSVRNGTVRGFAIGVQLTDSTSSGSPADYLVEDLRALDNNQIGISVSSNAVPGRNVVRRNAVMGTGGSTLGGVNCIGIVANGHGSQVSGNVVSGVADCSLTEFGIFATACNGCSFEANDVKNDTTVAGTIGLNLNGDDLLVADNRLARWGTGIDFGAFASGLYRDNLSAGCTTPFDGGTDAGNNQ